MAVPYAFATATGSLPLSQLDANFSTGIVIGNTTVTLGDTITTINNLTLANVTVTSASFSNVTLSGTTTVSGNTTVFSGTGARIQGDFSNATVANRTAFQDKTTNTATQVNSLPNGSAVGSGFVSYASSDPTNSAYGSIFCDSSSARISSAASGGGATLPLVFNIGGSEAARFTTDSRFLVGTTNNAVVGGSGAWVAIKNSTVASYTLAIDAVNQSGTYYLINFGAAGTQTGYISSDGTTTSYNTTSDYRLKENVQPMTGALAKVQALNPVTYTWKKTGTSGQGFIAHELQAVIPEAATGVKDDVDDEGNPRYQGMDTSHIVATLVAAVKELTARVAALEAA